VFRGEDNLTLFWADYKKCQPIFIYIFNNFKFPGLGVINMQKITFIAIGSVAIIVIVSLIVYFQVSKQVEIPIPSEQIVSEDEQVVSEKPLPGAVSYQPKATETLSESSSEVIASEAEYSGSNLPPDDESPEEFVEEPEVAEEDQALPDQEDQAPPEESQVYVLLEETFPEIGRIKEETQKLMSSINSSTATLEDRKAFETKAKALETEIQDICKRIAEVFPETVTFITFQGQEWATDIDFRKLQTLAGDSFPASIQEYFRYANLREMLRSPN